MEIIVRGKHFDVPALVEERARTKLGRLPRYLPLLEEASAEVDIAHEKAKQPDKRFVVHVTVSAHGVHLRAEERAAKLETAVDQVVQALNQQARKHKEQIYRRSRAKATKATPATKAARRDGAAAMPRDVTKVKRFAVNAMTAAEALEQMEMLKHDFFLFFDADADQVSLLYRRRAGDYGLIVPELS